MLDILAEDTQWFMLEDKQLSPGVYRMKHDSMTVSMKTHIKMIK